LHHCPIGRLHTVSHPDDDIGKLAIDGVELGIGRVECHERRLAALVACQGGADGFILERRRLGGRGGGLDLGRAVAFDVIAALGLGTGIDSRHGDLSLCGASERPCLLKVTIEVVIFGGGWHARCCLRGTLIPPVGPQV
jgi:hypothetical protein